jgi:hypothetical protein
MRSLILGKHKDNELQEQGLHISHCNYFMNKKGQPAHTRIAQGLGAQKLFFRKIPSSLKKEYNLF